MTDFAVHRPGRHPGSDQHLCLTGPVVDQVTRSVGRPAVASSRIGQTVRLLHDARYLPVVLCGENRRLRRPLWRRVIARLPQPEVEQVLRPVGGMG